MTFLLYGLAVAPSDAHPKWLGWVAAAAGFGVGIIGLVITYNGLSLATAMLFMLLVLLFIFWMVVIAPYMWRRASAIAQSALPQTLGVNIS